MSIRHILPSTGKQNSCRGTRLTIVDLSALAQRKETLDVAFGLTSFAPWWLGAFMSNLAKKSIIQSWPKLLWLAWKGVGCRWKVVPEVVQGPSSASRPQSTTLSHGDSESFSEPGQALRCAQLKLDESVGGQKMMRKNAGSSERQHSFAQFQQETYQRRRENSPPAWENSLHVIRYQRHISFWCTRPL